MKNSTLSEHRCIICEVLIILNDCREDFVLVKLSHTELRLLIDTKLPEVLLD